MTNAKKIGAVILAAGGSVRLGEPKQFLEYEGETFVRRAARIACGSGCNPVVVVAGIEHARVKTEVAGLEAHVLHHPWWNEGIGSSLRAGAEYLFAFESSLDAMVVMVCDQPFVTSEILETLIVEHARRQGRGAACVYGKTIGVPALIDRSLFSSLLTLREDRGAKAVLAQHASEIALVGFPAGQIDIDTPADRREYLESTAPARTRNAHQAAD